MAIRFQAAADLSQTLVSAVLRREPKTNFRTAFQAKLANLDDRQVLEFAKKDSQQIPIQQFVENILLIWSVTEMDDSTNRIAAIPI